MLPEHVKMLKDLFSEQDDIEKPIVDEQQIWKNDVLLQGALREDLTVQIQYFAHNQRRTVEGKILFIDTLRGVLQLEDTEIILQDLIEVNVW